MPHRNAPLTETGRLRLARYGCPPLVHLDRASGRPVRRYERAAPGELVHVDIKKLGNIPDGSGWRVAGQARGYQNKKATTPAATGMAAPPSATATCTPPSIRLRVGPYRIMYTIEDDLITILRVDRRAG